MALLTTPLKLANGVNTLSSTIQLQNYSIHQPSPKPTPDRKVISNDVTTLSPTIQPQNYATCQPMPSPKPKLDWKVIDQELRQALAPVSEAMNQDVIGTTEAANSFSSILVSHLQHYGIIQTYNYHSNHHDRSIIKYCKILKKRTN